MDTNTKAAVAFDLGRSAFLAGKTCAPALDPQLLALLAGNRLGEGLGTLKAWSQGWHSENAAAEVA